MTDRRDIEYRELYPDLPDPIYEPLAFDRYSEAEMRSRARGWNGELKTRRPAPPLKVRMALRGAQLSLLSVAFLVISRASSSSSVDRDLSLWTCFSSAVLVAMVPLMLWTVTQRRRLQLSAVGLLLMVFAATYFGLHWGDPPPSRSSASTLMTVVT